MVKPRSERELGLMRESGRIAAMALKEALGVVAVGVTTKDIDKIAEKEIYKLGGDLSYKSVPGYKWATCITVNEQVVHGIPTDRKIKEGDLVSIDLATSFKGWHTDCAWTVLIGKGLRVGKAGKLEMGKEKARFLEVGKEALWLGIKEAVDSHTVGDIGAAIQKKVEGSGYCVVRALVGHGVGRELHEEPEIPGFGKKGTGLVLKKGMTLAIEVIYAMGSSNVVLEKDGWTYSSADGSLSGLFEMTVVVGKKKAKVLTDWRKVRAIG